MAVQLSCMAERRIAHNFFNENLKKENHLEDLRIDVKVIFKWTLKKWCRTVGTRLNCVETGLLARCCVHCNELLSVRNLYIYIYI